MIPASAYATGPNSYIFDRAAVPGFPMGADRGTENFQRDLDNGLLVSSSTPIVPGAAVFYVAPNANIANRAIRPIPRVTNATPASLVANFAGIMAYDYWNERSIENIPSHDSALLDNRMAQVSAQPNTLVPRAVDHDWWVRADALTGIVKNAPVFVVTAAGATQGFFSSSAGLAIPATVAVFTGDTFTSPYYGPVAGVRILRELL